MTYMGVANTQDPYLLVLFADQYSSAHNMYPNVLQISHRGTTLQAPPNNGTEPQTAPNNETETTKNILAPRFGYAIARKFVGRMNFNYVETTYKVL
jgi:hypothetical protein